MEAKLQSLKVPELKELLQAADLSVSGNKSELIKRLLSNPKAVASLENWTSDAPAPSEPVQPQPTEPAQNKSTSAANEAASTSTENVSEQSAQPSETKREAQTEALLAELEKRKARAIRFGQPYEDLEKKIARIRKFGMDTEDSEDTNRLDSELKKGKPKAMSSQAPAKASASSNQPSEAPVDPEELERRKRRAERFGLVSEDPSEKKARRA